MIRFIHAMLARMFRRWFMFSLAATLLTLCVKAWGVSCWREILVVRSNKTAQDLFLNLGRVEILWGDAPTPIPGWYFHTLKTESWSNLDTLSTYHWLGFSYGANTAADILTVPLWFPSLLSALLLWFAWRMTKDKVKGFPVEPEKI